MIRSILALCACLIASHAHAAPAEPPICEQLLTSIEMGKKQQALSWAQGVGDNSAPRATLRAMETVAVLERANFNLKLLELNRCRTLPAPMTEGLGEYAGQALACSTEIVKGNNSSPTCVLASWQPGKTPAPP